MTNLELRFYEAATRFFCKERKIDWEQRRYEIAKELFVKSYDPAMPIQRDVINAKNAAHIANLLINELKEGGDE